LSIKIICFKFVSRSHSFIGLSIVVWCFCDRWLRGASGSEPSFDYYNDPMSHLSSYEHSESTSFDVGDHELCPDNHAGYHNPVYFGTPDASWSGVDIDLSEEPGCLLHFLRDKR